MSLSTGSLAFLQCSTVLTFVKMLGEYVHDMTIMNEV